MKDLLAKIEKLEMKIKPILDAIGDGDVKDNKAVLKWRLNMEKEVSEIKADVAKLREVKADKATV
jgi:hypothetical protein